MFLEKTKKIFTNLRNNKKIRAIGIPFAAIGILLVIIVVLFMSISIFIIPPAFLGWMNRKYPTIFLVTVFYLWLIIPIIAAVYRDSTFKDKISLKTAQSIKDWMTIIVAPISFFLCLFLLMDIFGYNEIDYTPFFSILRGWIGEVDFYLGWSWKFVRIIFAVVIILTGIIVVKVTWRQCSAVCKQKEDKGWN
ncbi:MAG TPA: hypothetical protein ENH85_00685 [Candidatus Scalindua sp.]|nr:hypothetical protein [Candidatus Scalindua sp.]